MTETPKRIWVTHCSKDKAQSCEISGEAVTPDVLYTSRGLQAFIQYCKDHEHPWAIFSDNYGVVFPDEKIRWYNKPPSTVTAEEFDVLVENFTTRLGGYNEIFFLHRPGETHPVFERVVEQARAAGLKVEDFDLDDMERGD